jgi:hypothetical protein
MAAQWHPAAGAKSAPRLMPGVEAVEKPKSTFTDYPISKESAAFF